MKLNDSSNVVEFKFEGIGREVKEFLQEDFQEIWEDIVKIDGEYYHAKEVSVREMLNELIGSYYSNLVGLDAVQYKIGIIGDKMYALSKVFFQKGFTYLYPNKYFDMTMGSTGNQIEERKKLTFFFEASMLDRLNTQEARDSILKMSAVDLKMNQADRHTYNIIFRIIDGRVYIEKIFDFGWAYDIYPTDSYSSLYYENPFIIVRKDYVSLSSLAIQHPLFRSSIQRLCEVPVGDVLREIEKANNVTISKEDYKYYRSKDKEYTKILRKVR